MAGERIRLYVKGSIMGYKRAKRNQTSHTSLIKIDGVADKSEVEFYLGKRIAFIYKAKTLKKGTFYRCIWGKVSCVGDTSPSRRGAALGRGPRKTWRLAHFIARRAAAPVAGSPAALWSAR